MMREGYCCLCHSLVVYESSRQHPWRGRRHLDLACTTVHPSLNYNGSQCNGLVIPIGGRGLFARMPVPERWRQCYKGAWYYYRKGYQHGYRRLVPVAWMAYLAVYQAGYAAGSADIAADRDVPRKELAK